MFENVIGQDAAVSAIVHDLKGGTLPPTLLIDGPRYSGKGTIALEIARVLTCRNGRGDWSCDCASCRLHRELAYPEFVAFGPRDFAADIAISAETVRRDPRRARRFLFVRSVRRLAQRFDPRFRVGRGDAAVDRLLEKLLESTDSLLDERLSEPAGVVQPAVDGVVSEALSLVRHLPNDHYPVDRVRAITSWSRVAGAQGSKVVVCEEAHTMQSSAQNALLKVLEEPPQGVYFVLCSSRPSAIRDTVLSRVRRYSTVQRAPGVETDVLARIFSVTGFDGGLERYFRRVTIGADDGYAVLVESLRAFVRGNPFDPDRAVEAFQRAVEGVDGRALIVAAADDAARGIDISDTTALDRDVLRRRWGLLRRHIDRVTARNINAAATFRSLLFSQRGEA